MNPCLQCVASEEIRFGHLPCSARGDGKNSSDWLRGRHVSVCFGFYYSFIARWLPCPSQIVSPKSRCSANKFEQSPGPRRRRRTLQYQTSRPPDHTSSQALAEAPHARARLWTRQRLAPSHAARWQPTHRRIGCRQAVCLQLCPASVLIRKEVRRVLCTWSSACPSLEHAPAPACPAMDASLWSNALRRR